jgi:hypothetical protein
MAVGEYTVTIEGQEYDHPLSALWNGSTWSLKTVPEPGGYRWDSLADLSCIGSPVICTAVGNSYYPGEEMLAVRWNGSAWVSQAKEAYLGGFTGVSCSTTDSSSCVSVGSAVTLFLGGEGDVDLRPTAARWDGTNWAGESTTDVFGSGGVLRDVSCRGSTCIAVGFGGNILSGEGHTLVESTELTEAFGFADPLPALVIKPASSSTPTSATLRDSITPNGLSTTYQFEYGTTTEYGSKAPASPKSIGSGTSPVERESRRPGAGNDLPLPVGGDQRRRDHQRSRSELHDALLGNRFDAKSFGGDRQRPLRPQLRTEHERLHVGREEHRIWGRSPGGPALERHLLV